MDDEIKDATFLGGTAVGLSIVALEKSFDVQRMPQRMQSNSLAKSFFLAAKWI